MYIKRSWCVQEIPEPLQYFSIEYSSTFQSSPHILTAQAFGLRLNETRERKKEHTIDHIKRAIFSLKIFILTIKMVIN